MLHINIKFVIIMEKYELFGNFKDIKSISKKKVWNLMDYKVYFTNLVKILNQKGLGEHSDKEL